MYLYILYAYIHTYRYVISYRDIGTIGSNYTITL